jgi:hypothetical protein
MERPLTVAGLVDKRAELIKLRDSLSAELQAVTFDLDHLDATIRLFDPDQTTPIRKRYTVQHAARGGEMARFVLSTLRTASEPLTARQIGLMWAESVGVEPGELTARTLRKRVGSCLGNLARKGLVASAGEVDDAKVWRLANSPDRD